MSDPAARLAAALADRYRIDRKLGEGGMAVVYLAEDLRHHRKVALKVLRPELGAVLGAERFLREIEIAASLRHPHILPLYDSGEVREADAGTGQGPGPEPLLFYVMPLVEGESLRARMQRERQLPIEDALRFAREVADALSYAHARGVVHRDIKPENILIESGHAVVADFGIAKAVASASETGLTRTGTSIGTPTYMSPEQAAADPAIDGRSDLYSLACVLYEMLAGQPPFIGTTVETLVRQHIAVTPPPVTQFRPAVPAAVSDALMRALAKNPADRFNPVGQFATALGDVHASAYHAPAHPTPASHAPAADTEVSRPPAKGAGRWRIPAAVALGFGILAAVWAIVRRPATATIDSSRSIAVLPFENLGGDSATAPLILGMHSEIVTQLTKIPGLKVAARKSALEYRDSGKEDRQIASELGVVSLVRGSVQRSGNQVRFSVSLSDARRGEELWAETYDREFTAENLFAVQGDIARQVASALSVRLSARQEQEIARAPTTNLAALDLYYRSIPLWDDRGSVRGDTLMIRQLERAVSLDPRFAAAWGLLAQARSWMLRQGEAWDTLPAWSAVERVRALVPGSLESEVASAYYRYYARADYAGALRDLAAAERILPGSGEMLAAMAFLNRRLGQWDETVALLERAAQADPRNAGHLANLGETYVMMRRPADADRTLEQSLALEPAARAAIEAKHTLMVGLFGDTARARAFARTVIPLLAPEFAVPLAARTELYARNYPAALDHFAGWPPRDFSTTALHGRLGRALVARLAGDSVLMRAEADTFLLIARPILAERRRRGPDDPFGAQAIVEVQMALAMALRGEHDAAERLAATAIARLPIDRDAVDGVNLLGFQVLVHAVTGRRAEAVALLERLLAAPSYVNAAELRVHPFYDDLRGEPSFQRLVGRPR